MRLTPLSIFAVLLTSASVLLSSTNWVLAADTTRPTVSKVSPTEATVGTQVIFTATVSDDESGIDWCELYVEFENMGQMNISGNTASLPHTFMGQGVWTVFVHCKDNSGNRANGHNTAVNVSKPSGSQDFTPPSVGAIAPTIAQKNVPVTLQASYADSQGVTSCRLIVDGFQSGAMSLSSGTASISYAFNAIGTYSVYAQCSDPTGNAGNGPTVSITVTAATTIPPPVVPPVEPPPSGPMGLVKTACPAGSTVSHPCRAVYYRTADGLRHAFPNSNIYFTWYTDFSGVVEISTQEMSSMTLGRNVTYRPGVRMVKFITDNKVYAVAKTGVLRWVSSESVAAALYGSNWNTKIDDLSDAFATDYSTGLEIMTTSDYSPAAATNGTTSIEMNF